MSYTIKGVTVHVFVPKIFGTGFSVRYTYRIVLTTAQVKFHWELPVLYIVTFDMKQSLNFKIMYIFSGNSNNFYKNNVFVVAWQIAV